ncbi:hypothetical protein [Streptomyces sp. NPDC088258]|uniref:hypothetical protein n=1 Tax=Streptomyces sp. NPDC088258 TaxID=3365849 RepID=UPI0038063FF8
MTDQHEQFTYTDADGDVLNIAPVQDDDGTDMVWLSTKTTDDEHGHKHDPRPIRTRAYCLTCGHGWTLRRRVDTTPAPAAG